MRQSVASDTAGFDSVERGEHLSPGSTPQHHLCLSGPSWPSRYAPAPSPSARGS